MENEIKRGEIYYIYPSGFETSSEQIAGRPAIIVSNDKSNEFSPVAEVVFLTTKNKTQLPTHVEILSSKLPSTALCEQISTISKSRIGKRCGECTDEEMSRIEKAMCISIGIKFESEQNVQDKTDYDVTEIIDQLIKLREKAICRTERAKTLELDEYWSGFLSALAESICLVNQYLK